MGIFQSQNPGIGGLDELTDEEAIFLQNIANQSYTDGDILKIEGGTPIWTPDTSSGGGSTCLTTFPNPLIKQPTYSGSTILGKQINDNTKMYVGMVNIPTGITANSISIMSGNTITTPGTLDITLYSEDGGSQLFSVTTATIISSTTLYTTALSAIVIPSGNYYIAINSNLTFDGDIYFYNTDNAVPFATNGLNGGVASEPIISGYISISAGTPATTFNPTSGFAESETADTLICRLDN